MRRHKDCADKGPDNNGGDTLGHVYLPGLLCEQYNSRSRYTEQLCTDSGFMVYYRLKNKNRCSKKNGKGGPREDFLHFVNQIMTVDRE
jgi:hypothetical protein